MSARVSMQGEPAGTPAIGRAELSALRALAEAATQATGIRLPDSKLNMLHSRVLRRLRELGLGSVGEYAARVLSAGPNDPERVQFLDAVTTNKTEFFREASHFTRLCNEVLPALLESRSQAAHVKVWSAGCSTGQEPYSLAMALAEVEKARAGFGFSVLGTDLSTRVLGIAKRATYPGRDVDAEVPQRLRESYWLAGHGRQAGLARAAPQLRRRVGFERLNLMDERYPLGGAFDVIFFRNVLIYFDKPTQEAVIRRQCRHLRPGGYLFVGHSESLSELDVPLESMSGALYRRTRG